MLSFKAKIFIIGINPYVSPPATVLKKLFKQAEKDKGPIPVKGIIEGHYFIQTLVKYSGKWRLYINATMLKGAGAMPGNTVNISIEFDASERTTVMHPELKKSLQKNKTANKVFEELRPSLQREIMRYINKLKTAESIKKNVENAIGFLSGKKRFIGRNNP